jgi:8-oxo-dGTP pyrophosphatase MutT (NUDIX family)
MNPLPAPAATVAPLRTGADGPEVLLLRRNPVLAFHGGAWVFPGGRVDPNDGPNSRPGDPLAAARRAAVREAREEADLRLVPEALIPHSRWTTPEGLARSFVAWVFLAEANDGRVRVDGGEIHAHRWMTPREALERHRAGEMVLPPPTFVTLLSLRDAPSPAAALASAAARPPRLFVPRILEIPGGRCSLYAGDAGYADGALDRPGPRHRLWMNGKPWRYEYSPEDGNPEEPEEKDS